ncbi:AraD1 family protein [Methylobacterium sp. CM6257]
MGQSLLQFRDAGGRRGVAMLTHGRARRVAGMGSVLDLARKAPATGDDLATTAARAGLGGAVDLDAVRPLPPVDHADPAHLLLSGTGLTHLGSAKGRDTMHRGGAADPTPTASMGMFRMGVEGGKPAPGEPGVQPEWFYEGDGSCLVAPGEPLVSPAFARDGGEEQEIAGIHRIDADGTPVRLGFAPANAFSDRVTERGNHLRLAHPKLRPEALGPVLRLGALPSDVRGASRILRDRAVIWEKRFLSGEGNMSQAIANLERHHFKYAPFRRPGDVHVHFFGTATLSFGDGVTARAGDVFEIEASLSSLPLRNPLAVAPAAETTMKVL